MDKFLNYDDNKFGLGEARKKLVKMTQELPIILANQAQNFFVSSFKNQAWEGNKWAEVRRRIPNTKEWKYPLKRGLSRRTKPILIGRATLKRAVSSSIRTRTMQSIKLIVDLPYADAQNEGNERLPKRQYMGDSPTLRKDQRSTIIKYTRRIWQR